MLAVGQAADALGLSSTTGAFAAGVLLAGSQYRAQIEADIKPFEGILLGVFFMTAGANLDPALCLQEWPTLLTGILAFIGVKAGLIFFAGEFSLGLSRGDAVRTGLLLAGGGEFAFVIFKLAEKLGVLPDTLAKLLTASVIISMSLTPILGEAAELLGDALDRNDKEKLANLEADMLFDAIDSDGDGSITMDELQKYLLGGGAAEQLPNASFEDLFNKLDLNGDGRPPMSAAASLIASRCLQLRGGLPHSTLRLSPSARLHADSLRACVCVCVLSLACMQASSRATSCDSGTSMWWAKHATRRSLRLELELRSWRWRPRRPTRWPSVAMARWGSEHARCSPMPRAWAWARRRGARITLPLIATRRGCPWAWPATCASCMATAHRPS